MTQNRHYYVGIKCIGTGFGSVPSLVAGDASVHFLFLAHDPMPVACLQNSHCLQMDQEHFTLISVNGFIEAYLKSFNLQTARLGVKAGVEERLLTS